jgi:ankyrin repeat protein
LLTKGGPEVVRARDNRGDLALHMAAQQGHPMCTYNLAKVRGRGRHIAR